MEVKTVRTMAIQSEDWRVVSPLLVSSLVFICLELPLQAFCQNYLYGFRSLCISYTECLLIAVVLLELNSDHELCSRILSVGKQGLGGGGSLMGEGVLEVVVVKMILGEFIPCSPTLSV